MEAFSNNNTEFPADNVKNIIAEGEYVVVESTGKSETKTEISNSPAYCDIYRIKDEKIQELTTYVVDTALNSEAH